MGWMPGRWSSAIPSGPDRTAAARQDLAAAAVAIDAAPITGVIHLPLSALRVASIALRKPTATRRCPSPRSSSATGSTTRCPGGNPRAIRALDGPVPGQAVVRSRTGELLPAVARQGQHAEQDPGPLLLIAGGGTILCPPASPPRPARSITSHLPFTGFREFPTVATHSPSTTAGARSPSRRLTGSISALCGPAALCAAVTIRHDKAGAALGLALFISAGGQAGMEFPAEPCRHRGWPGTGILWQAVHHGLRS